MQDYRTRLISDVATGKFDVRGAVLPTIGKFVEAGVESELSTTTLDEEMNDASPSQ